MAGVIAMYPEIPEPLPPPVMMKRPFAWVTWILVGSTVAVFACQLLALHLYGYDAIGDTLAFSPQAWDEGRYWTLITYAWAHAVAIFGDPGLFWLHIFANMLPLICIGPALEDLLGRWRFLGLYLGGVLASVLVWFFFNLHAQDGVIGASGAVFALIAAAGTAAPNARVVVYLFLLVPIPMSLRVLAITACAIEVGLIVLHWMPEVAHSAHLGGAAFGFLYIMALRQILRRRLAIN